VVTYHYSFSWPLFKALGASSESQENLCDVFPALVETTASGDLGDLC
jgi:hypothetical protein